MEKQTAEKYPLFKDYDFGIYMTRRGGEGILLLPTRNVYVPRPYGFGLLSLAPYFQLPFKDGRELIIEDLIRELKDNQKILFIPDPVLNSGSEPFLYTTLRKYVSDMILKINKKVGSERTIHSKDVLSAGDNYDKVRVYRMDELGSSPIESQFF